MASDLMLSGCMVRYHWSGCYMSIDVTLVWILIDLEVLVLPVPALTTHSCVYFVLCTTHHRSPETILYKKRPSNSVGVKCFQRPSDHIVGKFY